MTTKQQYTVTNVYGIRGETHHRTPETALKAASKREGDGWIVTDQAGNRWGRNGRDDAVIVREDVGGL